jgi:hypothetical protein
MVTGEEQLRPYTGFPFVSLKDKRETAKEPLYRKLFFGYELSIITTHIHRAAKPQPSLKCLK